MAHELPSLTIPKNFLFSCVVSLLIYNRTRIVRASEVMIKSNELILVKCLEWYLEGNNGQCLIKVSHYYYAEAFLRNCNRYSQRGEAQLAPADLGTLMVRVSSCLQSGTACC